MGKIEMKRFSRRIIRATTYKAMKVVNAPNDSA